MAGKRFNIQAVISMIDRASGPMGKVNKSVNRLNKGINRVGGRAAKAGMVGIGVGAGLVARQFVEFDDAIFGAAAKFSDLDITTAKGQKTLEKLRQTARKVGGETKFNAVEAAQGLDFLAMAGFNTTQSMKLLPGVANIATVANVDLATATDIASDALGAFGLNTKDTTKLTENFNRVQDVMARTVTMTNTSMADLFETIKFGAPPFTAAGQSMETFNAIAGRMASSGIKGSSAGTALRSAILRLQKPTAEVSEGLSKFGLSIDDIVKDGKIMDMVDIMAMWEKNGKKMTTVQRNAALTMIVGKNAVSGWAAVMNEGVKETQDLKTALEKSGGSASKMAKIIEQSLGNRIKALGSAATEMGFKIISAFAGDGKKGIDSLTQGIRDFDVTPIVTSLKVMFAIVSGLFTILSPFLPLITGIVIAIKAWTMATAAFNTVMAIKNAIMGSSTVALIANKAAMVLTAVAQGAMTVATTVWNVVAGIATGVTAAFGAVMAVVTGPIGLVIAAVAGLVAIGATIYENWEPIKAFFVDLWGGVKNAFWSVIDWISEKFRAFVDFFKNKIKAVKDFLGFGDEVQKGVSLNKNISGTVDQNLVMPQGGNTTGNVNINVTGQKENTSVKQSGTMPPNTQLNLGLQ